MIQSMKLRGALVFISIWFAPALAFAEARWCTWTAASSAAAHPVLHCESATPCTAFLPCPSSASCINNRCIPSCSTIQLAVSESDCSSGYRALVGVPPATDVPGFVPTGVCLSPDESVCMEEDWTHWDAGFLHDEVIGGATIRVRSPAWGFGDFDDDGCINASDETPCEVGGVCTGDPPPLPTSCLTPRTVRPCCVLPSGEFECNASCSPTATECSTLLPCTPGVSLVDGAQCPGISADNPGVCAPVTEDTVALPGLCIYPEFFCPEGTSADLADCFHVPGSEPGMWGGRTANFFEGDCDGDGCPNGYDQALCDACDNRGCRSDTSDPRVGTTCPSSRPPTEPRVCPPDAGTDAGHDDAGPNDAGMMDAPSPMSPDAGRISFGGGGGCNCMVGAHPQSRGASLVLFGLIAWVVKRRRRNAA